MRRIALIPVVLVTAALLAGCGGAAPGGSSTATPAPTSTPAETAPSDAVTRIVIVTEGAEFVAGSAVVDGFGSEDAHDATIAKLTEVFGADPVSSDPGQYDWGGFLLYFSTDPSLPQTMGVQATVAEIGGVEIVVGDGIRVGTPWSEVEAAADRIVVLDVDGEVTEARFDVVDLSPNEARFIAVYGAETGAVTTITGPITAGSIA